MPYFTYVLKSQATGKLYKGVTQNIAFRIEQHNAGLSSYTRGRWPRELVYMEEFQTRVEALSRERFFKSGKGREFLRSIIE